ncbi:hypothetical protein HYH02_005082 [Chlamydomonas schloesseri]|uniref:YCII-related domain-containing protein n=1 Tax=Chlamydomonas schloesseri TaxID=2026947 RepID=A0A835WN94_9CHLO|nr:hypothetical protein HYH02_005082 [Chlamydomonas schloesseri]|eukprot:KAG2450581.1 hypothetical protein HYH02_005082 [Chlamydomonas schloesseri]
MLLARLASSTRALGPRTRSTVVRAMASAAPAPKYYLLEYKYVPDILEKRTPYRAAHIEGAKKQAEAGKMVMAGAFGETPEGALFVFRDTTPEDIEKFVKADPYVQNGLVPAWHIKPYAVVVGPLP